MNSYVEFGKELASIVSEFLKGRPASYQRKLDKKEKNALKYAKMLGLRIKELNIDDKVLNKYLDKFFKYL